MAMRPQFLPDFTLNSVDPGRCFITHHVKNGNEDGIFRIGSIATERGWVEVSIGAIEELAKRLDWRSPQEVAKVKDQNKALKKLVKELEEQVDQSRIEAVMEITVKYESERRKNRRYLARNEKLEAEMSALKDKVSA